MRLWHQHDSWLKYSHVACAWKSCHWITDVSSNAASATYALLWREAKKSPQGKNAVLSQGGFFIRFTCKGKFAKTMAFLYSKELILSVPSSSWAGKRCYSVAWFAQAGGATLCISVLWQTCSQHVPVICAICSGVFHQAWWNLVWQQRWGRQCDCTCHIWTSTGNTPKCFALLCFAFGAWAPLSKSTCFP